MAERQGRTTPSASSSIVEDSNSRYTIVTRKADLTGTHSRPPAHAGLEPLSAEAPFKAWGGRHAAERVVQKRARGARGLSVHLSVGGKAAESATLVGPHGRTAACHWALSVRLSGSSREDSAATSMASQHTGGQDAELWHHQDGTLQHAASPTSRTVQAARRHRSARSPSGRQRRPRAGPRARARRRSGRPWSPLAGCLPGWPNAVESNLASERVAAPRGLRGSPERLQGCTAGAQAAHAPRSRTAQACERLEP